MEDKNIIIEKYKKQFVIFLSIGAVSVVAVFVYFLITVLLCETFDTNAIIAYLVFAGTVFVFCLLFMFFEIKRNIIYSCGIISGW